MPKLNSQINKDIVYLDFPKLRHDTSFKVDSPTTPDYNCIAWAGKRENINWWPYSNDFKLDGASYGWPFGIIRDSSIRSFITLFEHLGYNQHPSKVGFEPNHLKIVLFAKPDPTGQISLLDREATHAARQLLCGLWTSKLGQQFDIIHSNPYDLEGIDYGELVYILKLKFK